MAKPIETLSPTDEAIFRTATLKSLQGAAEDPERIGTEYMPEVVEGVSFVLANTSTPDPVILDAGAIAIDDQNNIVVHDGVTPGGVPYVPVPKNRVHGSHINTDTPIGDVYIPLKTIPITAAQSANGKMFVIRGTIQNVGYSNLSELYLLISGGANSASDGDGMSVRIKVDTSEINHMTLLMRPVVSSNQLGADRAGWLRLSKAASSDGALSASFVLADGAIILTPGAAQDIKFGLIADPTGTWASSFAYDITLDVY
jgi:hypothetical protein